MRNTNRRGNHTTPRKTEASSRSSNLTTYLMLFGAVTIVAVLAYILWPKPITPADAKADVAGVSPAKPLAPSNIDLYIDDSESMKGYVSSTNNNFIKTVSSLMNLDNFGKTYVGKKEYTGNNIITDLTTDKKEYSFAGASYLYDDLGLMAQKVGTDTTALALFITDGILSGSNEDIKNSKDGTFNQYMGDTFEKKISTSIQNACAKNSVEIGASVYQITSVFNGKYWKMDNSKTQINGERYFYIVALGAPERLAWLKNELMALSKEKGLKIDNEWHGIDNKTLTQDLGIDGNIVDKKDYYNVVRNKEKVVTLTIPATAFENFKCDTTFLDSVAKYAKVKVNDRPYLFIETKGEKAPARSTTGVSFSIEKSAFNNGIVNVDVEVSRFKDGWIKASSITDDRNELFLGKNTFLFENFVNGVKKGVNTEPLLYKANIKIKGND